MTTDVTSEPDAWVLAPIPEPTQRLDPLGDVDEQIEEGARRNFARVGSGRPSSLLYTYGPGAIMDLPQFTIMPAGLDDWDRIWARRDPFRPIHAPRLLQAVRVMLGYQVAELRPFPWQPKKNVRSREGDDLGVPARVFPQWLRCTGCDLLGPIPKFSYRNTHPFRTDEACFEHAQCRGQGGSGSRKARRELAVAARYLLVCVDGHVDEFPYDAWVHHGRPCAKADIPSLKMTDRTTGKGASATIVCDSCELRRPMNEAQGEAGRLKLPGCRGRHPHLDGFEPGGCGKETRLMLVGASNLWFAATQSIIVMPQSRAEATDDLADRIRVLAGDQLTAYASALGLLRQLLSAAHVDIGTRDDSELTGLVAQAQAPVPTGPELQEQRAHWDPVDLLVPEWQYLQTDPIGVHHDGPSGLTLSGRQLGDKLPAPITRVLAVDKLRKVNALYGFTRVDDLDRVGDLPGRLVRLTRDGKPKWTVATEDRGEGIFLQLNEAAVSAWEQRAESSSLWTAHREANYRNFVNRFSETAGDADPERRFKPARYWLVHTFAHVLIRGMAMQCGYSAASLSERVYAWKAAEGRSPAAGLLICTTASDSDGTLGGLVRLSDKARLERVVNNALHRARRCSSDPVCAMRTPKDPEDFLHGAACHCCAMASETSCERANRFLDRRFLINLPGSDLGFFG